MTSRPSIGRARIGLLNTMFSASSSLTWAGVGLRLPDSRSLPKGCIVIPPMLCYLLLKSSKGLSSRPIDSASLVYAWREARNKEIPDYAEIVRQINTCLDEIRHRLNIGELTQMLLTTPI